MRLLAVLAFASAASAAEADYLKDVKPILAARCYACHGALQQKADLRLDTAKSILAGGNSGPAVTPKKSGESLLLKHVRKADGFAQMPPPSEGEHLKPGEIERLAKWIDGGAVAPPNEQPDPDPRDHWAFRAPKRPPVPPGAANPIDAFLQAEWKKRGLAPQPPADKRILLRRVYLDLTGLPPTAGQIRAFLTDTSANAYEKLVDALLASPQYGERWGRHFLDIWRYSDWWGLGQELRNSQKHIFHWRDYVVESLNADLGYDEMIRDMLAADERHPTDAKKLRATGFLARQYFLFNRNTWLEETVEHTGKAFLGLTFNCAKCHDHKFDPISQADYYRLRAFFEPYQVRTDFVPDNLDPATAGIPRAFDCNPDAKTFKFVRGDEKNPATDKPLSPGLPPLLAFGELKIQPVTLPDTAVQPGLRSEIVAAYRKVLDGKRAKATEPDEKAVAEAESAAFDARLGATRNPGDKALSAVAAKAEKAHALRLAELTLLLRETDVTKAPESKKAEATKMRDAAKAAVGAAKKAQEKPGEAFTPIRGAVKAAESNVEPAASRDKPFPATSTGRRTALADWIADARNPLTARVLVNHVWLRHFAAPLVPTVFDFGRKGTAPTHPELLDWLAAEFTDPTVLASGGRQPPVGDAKKQGADAPRSPGAWSLKHLHRLIVTSAAYRMNSSARDADANLEADPDNKYLWRQNPSRLEAQAVRDSLLHLGGKLDLTLAGPSVPLGDQDGSTRRSLYFFQSHNDHNKFLSQFDDANVLDCYRRTQSVVPAQALALSNSKLAVNAAEAIAAKLPAGADDAAFLAAAFELLLGTTPTAEERAACTEALAEWGAVLKTQKHANPAAKARQNLIGALLNHNDFVTVR